MEFRETGVNFDVCGGSLATTIRPSKNHRFGDRYSIAQSINLISYTAWSPTLWMFSSRALRPAYLTKTFTVVAASPSKPTRQVYLLSDPTAAAHPPFHHSHLFPLGRTIMTSSQVPNTMKACKIKEQGDLDVINVHEVETPKPGKGEILFKVEWAGVNFIDTYQRGGIYKLPMPYTLGNESAGTIVSLGEDVDPATCGFNVGDSIAAYTAGGSFAEYAISKIKNVAKLPAGLSTKDAATILLQGLTALTLINEAHLVKKGEYILVQAAAGGLGLLLCQLASTVGAHVIGTTSTAEKAALAKAAGAQEVILYGQDNVNVVEEVYKITGGEGIDRGVHAVFDGVGKDTFEIDFELLRRKGTLVTLGNASGPVPPFAPLKLGPKNLKIVRPVLNQYLHTREEFVHYSSELFKVFLDGNLKLSVHKEYPLTTEGIKQSQVDITSRKTSGKLLIKVNA